MKTKVLFIFLIVLTLQSCGIFKIHHKDQLIAVEQGQIRSESLKLNGYYYTELVREAQSFDKTQASEVKYLSIFFIYDDGFVLALRGIDGLSNYYCAENKTHENTYESAHEAIALMLEAQHSKDKRIKQICGFTPDSVDNKGLAEINDDSIKIQFYAIERQSLKRNSNSAYLYEINGIITSDSTFTIQSETAFRTGKTTSENAVFRFKKTNQKPNIKNYFKKNRRRF